MERARGESGEGGGGARGLSQPLSQCKHVLIEIRSSGYNSFADVAARPPLSFSLHRSSPRSIPYLYEVPLRTLSSWPFSSSASVSRLCLLSRGVPLVIRRFAPSSITHFPFRGKEGCQGLLSYPETGQNDNAKILSKYKRIYNDCRLRFLSNAVQI